MVSHALFSDRHALLSWKVKNIKLTLSILQITHPDRIACGKSKVFPFAVSSPIGWPGPSAGARGDDEPGAATGKAATHRV